MSDESRQPANALPVPLPPVHRRSMASQSWAGHPLWRPVRRVLKGRSPRSWEGVPNDRHFMLRRVLLMLLVVFGAVIGTDYMVDIMPQHGRDWAERGLLVLFAILFGWVSAGFWTAVLGAWVMLRGRDRHSVTNVLRGAGATAPIAPEARTAIIMPICNEDVATVFAGLRATYESLAATDSAAHFDFYVLSDTNDPDARVAEQVAWTQLTETLAARGDAARVHYRWRQHRTHRKAGNVADFCRRFGADYKYMIVLDADSVMSGDCLVSLVRMMEAHPDTGIIQTAPRAAGHETTHARILQFCSRVYGPLFTTGLHYWQLGESHYWGHNAILRIEPFMAQCALPPLPGKTSLSGGVMSHDFVEAALMRRAGWKVWIAYDLDGSYEQVPPNLLSELGRDRRWAQGNLQNSRLTFEPGLHPVHRTVFVTGVLAYLSSPFWLAFLLLSTVLFATQSQVVPTYFTEPYQLFPSWPTANFKLMLTLFGLTAVLLLAPKVISLFAILSRGEGPRYGGAGKLLLSALLEFLHSVLLAPVRMLFHTQFVLAALAGIKLAWKSPPRHDAATGWGEAFRRHIVHTLLAVAWIVVILVSSTAFQWWLSPVLAGLLLAIPLSAWTSRSGPGRWLRRRGLFLIPEELSQPPVLAEADRHAVAFGALPSFVDAVTDAATHAAVLRAIPARPPARAAKAAAQARLVERAATEGPGALGSVDRLRLLGDAQALASLRARVQQPGAHPDWSVAHADAGRASTAPADEDATHDESSVASAH
ncbi:MAG: glucans biosynthesis glucosyltransferase MdoH [Pseudomonadota bacterium]